jgi:hypothetical protein
LDDDLASFLANDINIRSVPKMDEYFSTDFIQSKVSQCLFLQLDIILIREFVTNVTVRSTVAVAPQQPAAPK